MKGDTSGHIHIRVDSQLVQIIDKESTNIGLSKSGFCRMIILEHLKKIGAIKNLDERA